MTRSNIEIKSLISEFERDYEQGKFDEIIKETKKAKAKARTEAIAKTQTKAEKEAIKRRKTIIENIEDEPFTKIIHLNTILQCEYCSSKTTFLDGYALKRKKGSGSHIIPVNESNKKFFDDLFLSSQFGKDINIIIKKQRCEHCYKKPTDKINEKGNNK